MWAVFVHHAADMSKSWQKLSFKLASASRQKCPKFIFCRVEVWKFVVKNSYSQSIKKLHSHCYLSSCPGAEWKEGLMQSGKKV